MPRGGEILVSMGRWSKVEEAGITYRDKSTPVAQDFLIPAEAAAPPQSPSKAWRAGNATFEDWKFAQLPFLPGRTQLRSSMTHGTAGRANIRTLLSKRVSHWLVVLLAALVANSRLILTSKENGTEPQQEFLCDCIIHGYLRLPERAVGKQQYVTERQQRT